METKNAVIKSARLTDSYIQQVPDKCDRIVWRGNYYHLPLTPSAPADSVLEDAALEAVRKKLCALPRYSFFSDGYDAVRRVPDKSGSWIAFADAHALFDPVAVDAVRKQHD